MEEDVYKFDYLESPGKEAIDSSMKILRMIDALDKDNKLTCLG